MLTKRMRRCLAAGIGGMALATISAQPGEAACAWNDLECFARGPDHVLEQVKPLPRPSGPAALQNRYAVACIGNNTKYEMTYYYKWGNDNWKQANVYPGNVRNHWYPYDYVNENRSPSFRVGFYGYPFAGQDKKSYEITTWSSEHNDCNMQREKEIFENVRNDYTVDLHRNY